MQSEKLTVKVCRSALRLGALAVLLSLIQGCIADTPEDSNLPWASHQSWEGLAPIAPSVMNRYD